MNLYKSMAKEAARISSLALHESMQILENAKSETYYDPQQDDLNKKTYYQNVHPDTAGANEMYQQLNTLLKKTHTTQLTYDEARHKHLYTRVDLQPNRMLKSIYTGDEYAPEKIIARDFEIAEDVIAKAGDQLALMSNMNEAVFMEHLAALQAAATYNAEHTVPQSWFAQRYPMKSDLHHLFTCEIACNEFRGNIPFFDFTDFNELVIPGCGKKDGNKFEPAHGRGAVARATLYFLIRYPKEINNNTKEYTRERLQVLLNWHKRDAVSQYELHRNAEIFKVQGNRNPLIDHPEWSSIINFPLGLG